MSEDNKNDEIVDVTKTKLLKNDNGNNNDTGTEIPPKETCAANKVLQNPRDLPSGLSLILIDRYNSFCSSQTENSTFGTTMLLITILCTIPMINYSLTCLGPALPVLKQLYNQTYYVSRI